MAVPLNLPEDHNEVEVIITQLQYLLTKLQAALRRSRGVNTQTTLSTYTSTTRVRTSSSNRSRTREGQSTSSSSSPPSTSSSVVPSANLSELLNNLALLAAASQEVIESNSEQSTTTLRSSRSRTASESSYCDESKIAATVAHGSVQDWNQVGVILRKITDDCPTIPKPEEIDNESDVSPETKSYSREGIFSKIVPGPASAPLWTAVICFVGWHIFRAR